MKNIVLRLASGVVQHLEVDDSFDDQVVLYRGLVFIRDEAMRFDEVSPSEKVISFGIERWSVRTAIEGTREYPLTAEEAFERVFGTTT
jgi:hypothetical protein